MSRYLWTFGSLWAAIVAASFAFNMLQVKKDVPELARLQTRAVDGKNVARLRVIARRHVLVLSQGHALVGLVGLLGIVIAGRRLLASQAVIAAKNAELAERHRQLQGTYARLNQEFRIVGDVQVSLLPSMLPEIPGFEVATHYKPATQAGGDYFDFFALPAGKWAFMVADVSGHGAPAAVVMAMMRAILHVSRQWMSPDEVLAHLNLDLPTNIQPGQFVTAIYGVLDPADGTFTFSSAGHAGPVCLDPSVRRARVCRAETGFPIGIMPDARYPVSSITLARGALMILYTDGVTEAFDESGSQFGHERLLDVLQAHQGDSAAAVRNALLQSLDEHCGAVEPADDVALLIIRALPEGTSAARQDVRAPRRVQEGRGLTNSMLESALARPRTSCGAARISHLPASP